MSTTEAPTTEAPTTADDDWKPAIRQQLEDLQPGPTITHAIVHHTDNGPVLLDVAESQTGADISADDYATKVTSGGEISVHTLTDIHDGLLPADPDKGKLFDVPRAGVLADDSDPTVLKLAFSGNIELDRADASDVELYNNLKAGKTATLTVEAHVAGAKNAHRRDSEGNVDAVVQTKSLIIHSLDSD